MNASLQDAPTSRHPISLPLATLEDGTCEYTADEDLCPADVDENGTVNVSDLLGLLASFGEDCPSE